MQISLFSLANDALSFLRPRNGDLSERPEMDFRKKFLSPAWMDLALFVSWIAKYKYGVSRVMTRRAQCMMKSPWTCHVIYKAYSCLR